jgi:hypothetical protein
VSLIEENTSPFSGATKHYIIFSFHGKELPKPKVRKEGNQKKSDAFKF